MISFCKQALLESLDKQPTVNVRQAVATSLGRDLSKSELDTVRRAARSIANEGTAVLMRLFPRQAQTRGKESGYGERALLHLTVDEELIAELPYRVEVSTDRWDEVIREGKRRTDEMIDSDPVLSFLLRPPTNPAEPRPRGAALIAHVARLSSEAEAQKSAMRPGSLIVRTDA